MKVAVLALLMLLGDVAATARLDALVLDPQPGKQGPEKLLVFINGAYVPIKYYKGLLVEVQKKSELKLWVALVRCIDNFCLPFDLVETYVANAIKSAKKMGFKAVNGVGDVFLGGHSLGGVSASRFTNENASYAGTVTYGSMINSDGFGYPTKLNGHTPMLGITGELDLQPVSHAAVLRMEVRELPKDRQKYFPMIVVPGMDHSNFCPGYNVPGDVKREMSDDVAVRIISNITSAWLDLVSGQIKESALLEQYVNESTPVTEPFLHSHTLESSWCTDAQEILSGLSNPELRLSVDTDMWHNISDFGRSKVAYKLNGDGILKINTTSFLIPQRTPGMATAGAVACKLASSYEIGAVLGVATTPAQCKEANTKAFQKAIELVREYWPTSVQRFSEQGSSLAFKDDIEAHSEQAFLHADSLKWDKEPGSLTVQSTAFAPGANSSGSGTRLCKLVSVARLVDWYMSSSLTNRY